jgi:hypothetical protein
MPRITAIPVTNLAETTTDVFTDRVRGMRMDMAENRTLEDAMTSMPVAMDGEGG